MSKQDYAEHYIKQGKKFGYPECCIKEFCEKYYVSKSREKAANGTGFIPCSEHAKQVNDGKIKLADLIENRSQEIENFEPCPN